MMATNTSISHKLFTMRNQHLAGSRSVPLLRQTAIAGDGGNHTLRTAGGDALRRIVRPSRIDTVPANVFDPTRMGSRLDALTKTLLTAGLALLAGVPLLFLGGCAAPEPQQVKLEAANVLPLTINPDFVFRKKTQFLNDPAAFPKGGPRNEAIDFERRSYMWPATTQLDQDGLRGNYLNFYWWNRGTPADVTVRLEYRQANLGNFVMAREKSYSNAKGSTRTQFTVIGDDYLENGPVTNWRCLLIVGGRIVGLTQSYLWK